MFYGTAIIASASAMNKAENQIASSACDLQFQTRRTTCEEIFEFFNVREIIFFFSGSLLEFAL